MLKIAYFRRLGKDRRFSFFELYVKANTSGLEEDDEVVVLGLFLPCSSGNLARVLWLLYLHEFLSLELG